MKKVLSPTSLLPGLIFILALATNACNFPTGSANPSPAPTQTPFVVTATNPPSPSPASTSTLTPANTPPPLTLAPVQPQPAPLPASPTPPASLQVKLYLVAIGDNGASGEKIGCGDSLIPVAIEIPYTQGVLRAALNALLEIKDQHFGASGLYNALYQSDLSVEDLKIESGIATIQLSGKLQLGGVCDDPRVKGQLEATALQFSTVDEVKIFVNGVPLDRLLSEK